MKNKTNFELEQLSIHTRDLNEQKFLANHVSSRVRRNLALNKNLRKEIANELLFDCVVNVSYIASKNSNTTEKRKFLKSDVENKCVSCEKIDIHYTECSKCEK